MMSTDRKTEIDYSIVIPVFCNQGTLEDTYGTIIEKVVKKNTGRSYEIIFVDDGSYDLSFETLLKLKKENPNDIKIIKFTRNFGQVAAIMAGYQYASGKCIINLSADLQDPPEFITEMLSYFFKDNYEIVVCTRDSRDESYFRSVTSIFFYQTMKKLSFPDMPSGGFDFALISKNVKNFILANKEANTFWQGQILWPGYDIKFIPYKRKKRIVGNSKWTFPKKIKYLIDGVINYSYFPIRLMTVSGLIFALAGFFYAAFIFIGRLTGHITIYGWAPLMILILVSSGFQMLMIGIIGEYLWRTLDQVRNRPQYLIKKIYD